ncbi:hypothetical protein N7462_004621 [Penicillium macrosclerotiorum]|uniref:uncharacterized protein n=1 Tax=Penicillium macrosclerotiorum TaxID=303699 RepID=UPI002546F774|nr:uncharacterized protein N7462_004621 [Penicillium macrosclerotiorum]KAJ5690229.1 hypothetical protein N7462_004621 [Penicillium macrosclerotiorum]
MSAQEEFDQLVQNNRDKAASHPEDRDSSPHFSDDDGSSPPRHLRQRRVLDSSDEDEDEDNMVSSRGNYHIPNTVYDANTGPKGVIADAQAFERARKKSFRKTLLSAAGFDSHAPVFGAGKTEPPAPAVEGSSGSEDDEDRFMRKWRASRMQELQNRGMRRSPHRGRHFGSVDTVDAAGYLDAIEKVTSDTVVVVCIYDPKCDNSAIVEECLVTIARRQPTTHFVKLHHEIAEMDNIQAPALLAYRDGDVFATIVDIIRNIPKGRSCSADSLEDLLKLNRVL